MHDVPQLPNPQRKEGVIPDLIHVRQGINARQKTTTGVSDAVRIAAQTPMFTSAQKTVRAELVEAACAERSRSKLVEAACLFKQPFDRLRVNGLEQTPGKTSYPSKVPAAPKPHA
ncbi:MAG: hypothetical protein V4772_25300 [Pseudomonadota bacterium]